MALGHAGRILVWCAALDTALVLLWFAMFAFRRGWMCRQHSRWFRLSPEHFDQLHSAGIMGLGVLTLAFNLVPLAAWLAAC